MSHSPFLSRTSPLRSSLRSRRVIDHAPSHSLITSVENPVMRSVIVEERHSSIIGDKPHLRPVRLLEETSPIAGLPLKRSFLGETRIIEEVSPVHISPIKRQCVREVHGIQPVATVIRRRSVEPIHRGVISNKVPFTFGHAGVTVHPIPLASLEGDVKVGLYSEVERLSLLNLELKNQLDAMFVEMEENRARAIKVPDLERGIHDLQAEILQREQEFNDNIREQEILRIDNENLSRLGPAYNELIEHNKALISEIDAFDLRLKDLLHERDVLETQAESVKLLQPRLEDAANRIEIMTQDILDKEAEIADCRARIQELNAKIEALAMENEQVHGRSVDYLRERDLLLVRMEEKQNEHEQKMIDLRAQMEASNRAFVEQEKTIIAERCALDVVQKEEELDQAYGLIKGHENKLMILSNEIENLEKITLSKASEIDDLKMRICLLEDEKVEVVKISEAESCIRMERQLANQRGQYENVISQLRKDLAEADRVKLTLKQRDNEIEVMKAQLVNNERVWEMRMQKAVDTEVKSASSKFVLELSALETEASMNKDTAVKLENQVNFLTNELERMTHSQNQKIIEMNELQRKLTSQEMTFRLSLEEQRTKLEVEKKQNLEELRRDLERVHIDRIDEMRRFQSTLEERLMRLADDNARLGGIAEDRTKDVDAYSMKLRVMEDVYKQQVDEIHKKNSTSQKMAIEKEISSATIKHKGERAELECKVAQYSVDLERLRSQYQLQGGEIERLTQGIKDKELEIQQERRRYVELEIQRTRDIGDIREQFDNYKRANIDVNTLQVRFEAERASLASQIMQHKEKVSELEKRLVLSAGENDKLKGLYIEKSNELEIVRQRYRELEENLHNELAKLENENEYLKRSNLDGKEINIKYSSEKTQYENQIRQLKTINENGKQELEKLYELMNQRKKEHDYYIKQNDDLKKEVDRLARQLRDAGSETTTRKDKHEEFERRIIDLERDRDLYKEHNERLNHQLKQTHAELQEKIREMDITKKKYDESISKLSNQLDNDLMKKFMGGSNIQTSPEKKERLSFGGMEF